MCRLRVALLRVAGRWTSLWARIFGVAFIMRIPVTCGGCGRDFSAPQTHAGRKVVCPGCGQGVRVSTSGGAADEDDERPRPEGRGRRGGGVAPNPKVILGIFGAVAALVAASVAYNNLPSLAQLNQMVATSPAPAPVTSPAVPVIQQQDIPPAEPAPVEEPKVTPNPPSPKESSLLKQTEDPAGPKSKAARPRFDRSHATDEVDTEHGQQLFAQVKHVVLLKDPDTKIMDPRKAIWNRVAARAKVTVEKLGLEFSNERPGRDDAVLTVLLEMRKASKGTAGTQELMITAELTCPDPDAERGAARYATIWRSVDSLGTIARASAQSGNVPKTMDDHLTKYFGSFRVAHTKAVKAAKANPSPETQATESEDESETDEEMDAETAPESEPAFEPDPKSEPVPKAKSKAKSKR